MATSAADPRALAAEARRAYVEGLLRGAPGAVQAVLVGTRALIEAIADPVMQYKRRDTVAELGKAAPVWLAGITRALRGALPTGSVAVLTGSSATLAAMTLVDNDTIEGEILSSRLALAMMDRAGSEFNDLRTRMLSLERRDELDPNDVLRPHVLARIVGLAWHDARLSQDKWKLLQTVLHGEFGHFAEEAYHETNRWLMQRRVLPEVDLRPFIRRSADSHAGTVTGFAVGGPRGHAADGTPSGFGNSVTPSGFGRSGFGANSARGGLGAGDGHDAPASEADTGTHAGAVSRPAPGAVRSTPSGPASMRLTSARGHVGEETRMLSRPGVLAHGVGAANAVLGQLNRAVAQVVPEFAVTAPSHPTSLALGAAIGKAQQGIRQRLAAAEGANPAQPLSTPQLLAELAERKQALKAAATTPVERATIEIVALLFQSILTEERIPASVRVWFARLQMPVLRVAVGEPNFFATVDHPARQLIDRMGACVMGFDASSRAIGDALDKEIKRVVQVVEAYPDTGRRVFQTVLIEFEKFLEHYFRNENEATRKGVSLAQQVEQRETLAIQYTIELRKMLNEMPVQEGVREFLFHVWADVLAITAVKQGKQSEATKAMKRAATDLIWSAGAKVSREERSDVLRRLPPLLKTLRVGMESSGLPLDKQNEHIRQLNNALAAAFTAKTPAIARERLDELVGRLDSLEEMLPDAHDVQLDDAILDLSGYESDEIEVVGDGGSMPTPAMTAWARELQIGGWYMLEFRGRHESVQLAWHGWRRRLTLFVSPQGRGILFQQQRLAAFLQAGLLVPAEEESLTVRATRNALAKLDADPSRLLA